MALSASPLAQKSKIMKSNQRHGKSAFTLIELMAVITIIVILAGLVVGGLGYVTEKQAKSKATVQMALISKALEEFKLDMGYYPPTINKSGNFTAPAGTTTSVILFKYLYWDSDNDNAGAAVGTTSGDLDQKSYLADLDPSSSKQGWTSGTASATTTIVDPWGNQFCYRSALGTAPANSAAPVNSDTQNPDFDLWSMGKDGKTNASATHKDSRDDIKNF